MSVDVEDDLLPADELVAVETADDRTADELFVDDLAVVEEPKRPWLTFGSALLRGREVAGVTHWVRGGALLLAAGILTLELLLVSGSSDAPGRTLLIQWAVANALVLLAVAPAMGFAAARQTRADGQLWGVLLAEDRPWVTSLNLLWPAITGAVLLPLLQLPVALACVVYGGVTVHQVLCIVAVVASMGAALCTGGSLYETRRASVSLMALCFAGAGYFWTFAGFSPFLFMRDRPYAVTVILTGVNAALGVLAIRHLGKLLLHRQDVYAASDEEATEDVFGFKSRLSDRVPEGNPFEWLRRRFYLNRFPATTAAVGVFVYFCVTLTVLPAFHFGEAVIVAASLIGSLYAAAVATRRVAVERPARQGELLAMLPVPADETFARSRRTDTLAAGLTVAAAAAGVAITAGSDAADAWLRHPVWAIGLLTTAAVPPLAGRASNVLSVRFNPVVGMTAGLASAWAAWVVAVQAATVVRSVLMPKTDVWWLGAALAAAAPLIGLRLLLRVREEDDPWLAPTAGPWRRRYGRDMS